MKKILAICLSVLLICAAMPFAFATAAGEPTIVVSDVEGKAGDTVSVTVSLKNNPGIISARLKVGYDANALELIEATNGDFAAAGYSFSEQGVNPYVVNWCLATLKANDTSELLATLTFKIKDDAAAGEYPLSLVIADPDDFYNVDWDTVEFGLDDGSITVVEDTPVVPEEPVYTDPTIVVSNVEGEAGDTVNVAVSLKNNPGIISARLKIGYDANALELIEATNGDFAAAGYSFSEQGVNPYVVNWCLATLKANDTSELLATLTFKIKDDAAAGTYPLTLVIADPDDFYNVDWDTVEFALADGSITVIGDEPEAPECTHSYESDCDPICDLCGESRPVHTEGIIHFDAVDAGCHYIGNIEYWYCPECECYWADAELTQVTNSKSVILPAKGGDVAHIEAVEAGCHYNGNVEYWVCYECEQVWTNEALTELTNIKNVILPALESTATYVAAVEPTCQSEGNVEYWFCDKCEQVWTDEALTQLSNLKNVKIGVTDHNLVHFDAVESGCHYIGNVEYWFCVDCECVWTNEALTELSNLKNVITPAKGGDVAHIEAVAPGCHYNGNVEYWVCYECEQFWQDEALTQLTNSKNVILPALESTATYVPAKDATCDTFGNVEYWTCDKCEQVWADEALTQLTNIKNVQIAPTHTNLVHMEAVEAGCHYNGNVEYWVCYDCGAVYTDEALTQVSNIKNVIIPAKGGNVAHIEAVAPGCHYVGNVEYWVCYECEQVWTNEALTELTNIKNVILPALESTATYVPAVEPTCESEGNVEYWYCEQCEQVWVDEALTQLSNLKNVKIGVLDHNIIHMDAVEPGCHYIGNIEYWFCADCGAYWADEALTQVTNSKSVILPAKGGDVAHIEAVAPGCHYNGNIEYWVCYECEQVWADEALTQLTNSKNVILPALESTATYVPAKDATCDTFGNVEYWFCDKCEQVWVNEALTQLSNLKNVQIAPTHTNLVHMEAVEAACHYNGNVEYWVCYDCGAVYTDEALTQVSNIKNVIIPAKGGDVIAFEAIEPGCHYNGRIAYWYCAECDQFWADEALTQITNSKNVILPATGSDKLQHVEAKAPTATENGNVEYWFCAECEQVWTDEALTQLSNLKNVIIPATGEVEEPDSPATGDSTVAVVVALLTLIASGVAVSVLKNKKRA